MNSRDQNISICFVSMHPVEKLYLSHSKEHYIYSLAIAAGGKKWAKLPSTELISEINEKIWNGLWRHFHEQCSFRPWNCIVLFISLKFPETVIIQKMKSIHSTAFSALFSPFLFQTEQQNFSVWWFFRSRTLPTWLRRKLSKKEGKVDLALRNRICGLINS